MQQQFGAFLPPDIQLIGGSITTTASGSFANDTLTFTKKTQISKVTVQQLDPKGATPPKAIVQDESDDITADGSLVMAKDGSMSAAIKRADRHRQSRQGDDHDAKIAARPRRRRTKTSRSAVWDMLQSAKIQVAVPEINSVMKLIPPSTQPTTQPALKIGGGAVVNAEITRDAASQTTHITCPANRRQQGVV